MSDATNFPWRLHYSGSVIRLDEQHARQIAHALQLVAEQKATIVVDINYLVAAEPFTRLLLGPGVPAMLTGPAFTVADVVDR